MPENEVIDAPRTDLTRAVEESGLADKSAANLLETFQPFFDQAYPIARQAQSIVVTDATQLKEMKVAREARLKLKAIRVEAEKARKDAKEDALRQGKAIDRVAGVVKSLCEGAESHLQEQETFAERAEAARLATLKAAREEQIRPYVESVDPYDLAGMPAAAFEEFYQGVKARHEQKIREAEEARQKADADRLAREAEDRRIREENAKLAREKAEIEAKARAEREAHEAEMRRQQAEADKLRREAEAKARAEREEREAKEAAARKAAKAPDVEKIRAWEQSLPAIPTLKDEQASAVMSDLVKRLRAGIAELVSDMN